jgi:putative hemolysin
MGIISLIIVLFFFFLSAFFSGIETGFVSLNRHKMEQQARRDKKKKEILRFLDNPERLFGITLLGTNISNVIISSLGMYLLHQLSTNSKFSLSDNTSTLIIAGLVLIFGEIIPKALYRENSNLMVTRFFSLLLFFDFLFKPFVAFVQKFSVFITKVLHLAPVKPHAHFTKDDISYILEEAEYHKTIPQDQREMIEEVLEFTNLKAENVMVHRTEISALPKEASIADVIQLARKKGYTRFPVYEDDIDNIIGILILHDIFKKKDSSNLVVADLMREAYFVPENMDVQVLLSEMQNRKKSMMIVVDSYGGTAGLVTTEDILEEIVGEIEDEYDDEAEDIKKIDENTFIVKGFVEVDYLNDTYDMNLPICENSETLAGLILHFLARIPANGVKLTIGEWQITIQQATAKKIDKVKMKKNSPNEFISNPKKEA